MLNKRNVRKSLIGNYKNSYTINRNFKNFKNYSQLPKKSYCKVCNRIGHESEKCFRNKNSLNLKSKSRSKSPSFYKSKNNAFGDRNYKQKNVLNIHDLGKTNELLKLFTFMLIKKLKQFSTRVLKSL